MDAGVALNPETSVRSVKDILEELDCVLILTVEPGFGGQSYISGTEEKIVEVGDLLREKGHGMPIEVDGG